jgi:hypothetical protein
MTAAQYRQYLNTGHTDAKEVSTVKAAPSHTFGVMNGLETKYSFYLEGLRMAGEIQWWEFERVTLRLAKGTTYTPDFLVKHADGREVFHETKGGFERDDSKVKRKVAAEMFRGKFGVVMVRQNAAKNGWEEIWL